MKAKESIGDENAHQALDSMFEKMLQETKSQGLPLSVGNVSNFSSKPLATILNENCRAKFQLNNLQNRGEN